MKLKIEINLGLSPGAKKWSVRLGVPVVLLVAGGVAFAGLPGGYADGQPLTAAVLTNNFNYLQNQITTANNAPRTPSAFRAQLTQPPAVTLPNTGNNVTIVYNSVLYDLGNEYDATMGTFTPKLPGIYLVECGLELNSDNGSFSITVGQNGVELVGFSGANNYVAAASGVTGLAAGSPVSCQANQTSSSAQPVFNLEATRNYFAVTRLY